MSGETVAVLLRGDRELNEIKLCRLLGATTVELATEEVVLRVTGAPSGFAGPVGLPLRLIADQEVQTMADFVAGANEKDMHYTGVNSGRDFTVDTFADLRQAVAGDPCPRCEGRLEVWRGIEVGHVFKLGTKYSAALGAAVLDDQGEERVLFMGCYGIGIGRTVAAAIEQNHDANGIIWPMPIAPFQVLITMVNPKDEAVWDAAETLYNDLQSMSVEVLLDDRDERPGSKFKDADLLGIPLRVTVGSRGLQEGTLELQERARGERTLLPVGETAAAVAKRVAPPLSLEFLASNTPEKTADMNLTVLDNQGRLLLPPAVAKEFAGRPLELLSHSERHMLIVASEATGSVILAGRIGEIPIVDLLSFCNMFRKTGVLRFEFGGGSKSLYFQQGEVVNADSSFAGEAIGEILFGMGKISREMLQKSRTSASAELGRSWVGQGLLEAKDLWLASRQRAESIVYHLFTFQQGSFSFLHRELVKEEVLRLSMSTQNLLMEGLRRVDERALFMRRLRSLDAIPVVSGKSAVGLDQTQQALLKIVAEERFSVREAVRRNGLGEFEGLSQLYQLVEKGFVVIEDPPTAAVEGVTGEIVTIFNAALAALYRQTSQRNPAFREEVQLFLHDLPQPYSYVFRDVPLQENGTIDGGRILANLAGLEEGDKRKLLAEGLSELVYMECHAVRRELGAAEATELVQRVQEVSRRVKALIGRKE